MMTQRVMAQAVNQLSGVKMSGALSKSQSAGSESADFGDLMNRNINFDSKNADSSIKKSKIKTSDNKTNVYSENSNVNGDRSSKEVSKTEKIFDTSDSVNEVVEDVDEGLLEKVETKVKDIVKDFLGITDKELEEYMAKLGFQIMDIFNPTVLQNLIMNVNNMENISDLLVDETAVNQMSELAVEINNVFDLETTGLSENELEALKGMMQEIKQSFQGAEIKPDVDIDKSDNIESGEKQNKGISDEEIPVVVRNESADTGSHMEEKEQSSEEIHGKDIFKVKTDESRPSPLEHMINQFAGVQNNGDIQNFDAQVSNVKEMREIVNQIVEQIKVTIKPDNTSMELMLNPESLGRVNLSVVSKNGTMTAQFVVQNEAAKEAIQSQLQILKENFDNQGIKVEAVEVTVSNFGFGESDNTGTRDGTPKKQARRNINIDSVKISEDILSDEEELAVEMMEQNGGSIDYTA